MTDGLSNTTAVAGVAEGPKLPDLGKNRPVALKDLDAPDDGTSAAAQITGAPWSQARNQIVIDGFNPATQQVFGSQALFRLN